MAETGKPTPPPASGIITIAVQSTTPGCSSNAPHGKVDKEYQYPNVYFLSSMADYYQLDYYTFLMFI